MNSSISKLQNFRTEAYRLLHFAQDATFELMDAVLTVRNAYCLADFSLSPLFRRKWSSVYESLQDCRPNRNELMKLYQNQIPIDESEYVIMAIDHTAYSRLDSPTLKDRGYHHQPSSPGKTTIGQGYSTIAWIPEEKGSWALPLRHERITSYETPISKAVWQLKQVSKHSSKRILALLDSEYGNASYVNQTKNCHASSLIRLRSNLCLWSAPEQYSGRGRPKKHGDKFKLNDESTWWDESETVSVNDPKLGEIKIRKWDKLHFYKSPDVAMNLILVERLNPSKKDSALKPLWLVWVGDKMPPLSTIYQQYLRRFTVDHWYRLAKQRLHWTLPSLSTPHQCERWSDLMPLMTWQLWLAKDIIKDYHLPWQKPQTQDNLTPGRVAQSMLSLLMEIGTPAISPKPRGKSPGWQKDKKRTPKTRYPVVKKRKTGTENGKK